MTKVNIFTDGACSCNGSKDAIGGYGVIMLAVDPKTKKVAEKVLRGSDINTTNNKMELYAVIDGIKALKRSCEVVVISDSQYVVNGGASLQDTVNRGYKNKSGSVVANKEMWEVLYETIKTGGHTVTFQKVSGHSGEVYNERCDTIAKEQIKKRKELANG